MSTAKVINVQHPSASTTNIVNDASGNVAVGNNLTVAGTSTISGNETVTGTVAMGSSFKRNRIINGNMQVWQRATTATGNYSGAYTYVSVDRWAVYSSNTSTTFGQSTSVPAGFQYSVKLQRPSGSTATGILLMGQAIESVNCYDLSSQSVTLSFWAKAGANYSGGNLIIQGSTGTVADQGIATVGSWTGLATPISGSAAITTTWTKYTYTGTFGAGVLEAAIQFNYTPTGTAGADDAVYITGVQLEVGTKATPYEMQIYSDQLAQCQRYYVTAGSGGAGGWPSAILASLGVVWPVTMRTTPTLSITGTVQVLSVGNADKTATSPSLSSTIITASGARFDVSGFTGATAASPAVGDTNFIAASAEL